MSGRGSSRNFRYRGTQPRFVAQLPFDLAVYEPHFLSSLDDCKLTESLLQYHDSLLPPAGEMQSLTTLVNRVCEILDAVIVNPIGTLAGQIEEVRPVGSFKLGTLLAGHSTADVVIVTRTLPTAELLTLIQAHLQTRLQPVAPVTEPCHLTIQFYGFSVTMGASIIRVFVTTIPANLSKSNVDIHVNPNMQNSALDAIRQSRWLDENASNITRLLQLLASGMLLPGCAGVIDPCERGAVRLHTSMSLLEQDELCCTAQTLLRALLHGAHKVLFEFDEYADGVTSDDFLQTVADECGASIEWSEAVITPQDVVPPASIEIDNAVTELAAKAVPAS